MISFISWKYEVFVVTMTVALADDLKVNGYTHSKVIELARNIFTN
jgi:hypothetical protein